METVKLRGCVLGVEVLKVNPGDAETFYIFPVGIPSQYSHLVYNFSGIQLNFLNI